MSEAAREAERLLAERQRRAREVDARLYAITHPAEHHARQERARHAVRLLERLDAFPAPGDAVLEIGCGQLGWLGELLNWGLRSDDLHGIELDAERLAIARTAFPGADVRQGNATELPWPDEAFRLVILSTVLTSVLDSGVRQAIAQQASRVVAPGGAIVWYDFRWDNPRNPNVSGIGRRELRSLFPHHSITTRSLTLAPPLARRVAPIGWWLAETLVLLPLLRSHLLAVVRPEARESSQ